jgi:hypothetical protein
VSRGEPDIFDKVRLPPDLDGLLRRANPWWDGKPGREIPTFRRWAFELLRRRIDVAPLAPAVVLRGPRQVGKTTLLEQYIAHLIDERGVAPARILRVQFDETPSLSAVREPILALVNWFENRILGSTLNEAAKRGEPAYLFFDEVQNLADWAPQVKSLVDLHTVRVVITGSSALRIEAGRDSLAGRISTIDLGTLLLREIAAFVGGGTPAPVLQDNGYGRLTDAEFWRGVGAHGVANREARDRAFKAFSDRGGYPLVHRHPSSPWEDLAQQLNENVIKRVIQHDLRMGERGRKRDEQLLEGLFRMACRYAGQAPTTAKFAAELRDALGANIGPQRILSYLRFLDGALLVRLVKPLELRLKRQKGASKICLVDHGLRASWLQEIVPLDPEELQRQAHLADIAGHIAESVVGSFLGETPGLDLAHFPERGAEPEVDFVATVGEYRIPIEVKYRRRVDPHRDTIGLRAFVEKSAYNAPFGILVTMDDDVDVHDRRIVPVSLRSLLLLR